MLRSSPLIIRRLNVNEEKSSIVQVTAIVIKVKNKTFEISSDYTNIGKWSTFKVSAGDKGSEGGVTLANP